MKTDFCGKNEPKNEPGHVVEKTERAKSNRMIRPATMEEHHLNAKVRKKGLRSLADVASVVFIAYALCVPSSLFAQVKTSAPGTRQLAARVPFVGCKSDGQIGPMEAPKGQARLLPILRGAASQLAYYKAKEGSGVLAPRGWHCFGTYGSGGTELYVSPRPIDSAKLFSPSSKGFTGPAIELTRVFGGTSGRFAVAQIIARVFPAHRAFVQKIIKEGLEPPSEFPFGPYPKDDLNYKSSEIVEYKTPAGADGLGTALGLQENSNPISGVAILVGEYPDLLHLSVRLPRNMSDLTPAIIHQVERDAVQPGERGH